MFYKSLIQIHFHRKIFKQLSMKENMKHPFPSLKSLRVVSNPF